MFLSLALQKIRSARSSKRRVNRYSGDRGPSAVTGFSGRFEASKPLPITYTQPVHKILHHGTPTLENALDIIRGNGSFIIGPRNNYGTGLYLSDFATEKSYADPSGAILKVQLTAPFEQIAEYDSVINSAQFKNWCAKFWTVNIGDAIAKYTTSVLKKRFMRVNENLYVALIGSTKRSERVVFEGLEVIGVLDAQGNPITRR